MTRLTLITLAACGVYFYISVIAVLDYRAEHPVDVHFEQGYTAGPTHYALPKGVSPSRISSRKAGSNAAASRLQAMLSLLA